MNRDGVELIEKQAAFSGYFRIDRFRLRFPLYEGGMSREVVREVLERGRVAAVLLVAAFVGMQQFFGGTNGVEAMAEAVEQLPGRPEEITSADWV